jgi:hypothetical protein
LGVSLNSLTIGFQIFGSWQLVQSALIRSKGGDDEPI